MFSSHPSLAGSFTHGPYRIHYTVIASTLIPAEVAKGHGIKRSENTVLVNVALRRADKPVLAEISGSVVNLLEQEQFGIRRSKRTRCHLLSCHPYRYADGSTKIYC